MYAPVSQGAKFLAPTNWQLVLTLLKEAIQEWLEQFSLGNKHEYSMSSLISVTHVSRRRIVGKDFSFESYNFCISFFIIYSSTYTAI